MYRGSRLAASFLLFLTGSAVGALSLGVVPAAIGPTGPWVLVALAHTHAIAPFVALGGVARGRAWGRDLAVSIAEAGGGIAIAALIALAMGPDPLGGGRADRAGLAAWMLGLYALLGIAAGRVRLTGWSRRSRWWPAPLLRIG
ncbi:MAG: hypothetical protein ACXWXA_10855 [Candidatus Limnocylindrales bacterium]